MNFMNDGGGRETKGARVHAMTQQAVSTRFDLRVPHYVGILGSLVFLFGAPLGMAFNIGAIIDSFGVSKAAAGMIATAELFAVSIASLVTARYSQRLNARAVVLSALAVAALMNFATMLAESFEWLVVCRFAAGIAEGAGMSIIISIAARSNRPVLSFGLVNASVGGYIIPLSQVIHFPITEYGVDGAYGLYLVLNLVGLLLVVLIPRPTAVSDSEVGEGQVAADGPPVPALFGWIGLCGLFVLFFAHGGLLLFSERISLGVGISLAGFSQIATIGGILTVAGSLLMGTFGARIRATFPTVFLLGLMALLAYPITATGTPLVLYFILPVFMAIPIAWLPVFLGTLVRLDPSGRFAAANPAFITMGGAIAPMVTGGIADGLGFPALGVFTSVAVLLGLTLCLVSCPKANQAHA